MRYWMHSWFWVKWFCCVMFGCVELFNFAEITNNSESVSTEVKVQDLKLLLYEIERDYWLTVWETKSTPSKSFTWWNNQYLGINFRFVRSREICCYLATYRTYQSETWEQLAKNHLSLTSLHAQYQHQCLFWQD